MVEENNWLISAYAIDKFGNSKVFSEDLNLSDNENYSWIHIDANYPKSREWLKNLQKIDPIWIDALLAPETRPRLVEIDSEALLINLRGINSIDRGEPENMISVRVYITNNTIITSSLRKLKAVARLQNDFDNDKSPIDIYNFITRLSRYICDEIEPIIFALDNEIDNLEETILMQSDIDIRQKILDIRRQVIFLKRYMSSNLDVLKKLLDLKKIINMNIIDNHSIAENCHQMTRFVEEINSAKERVQVVHEEMNNHLTDKLNKNTFKLSIVATIFLPLSFLTGLFGVNLGGIPGSTNDSGFLVFCLIAFGIFLLQLVAFKWIYKV